MIESIWVYQYLYWDEPSGSHKRSSRYATMDAIKAGLGQPVLDSACPVSRLDLIDEVFYDPPKEVPVGRRPTAKDTE